MRYEKIVISVELAKNRLGLGFDRRTTAIRDFESRALTTQPRTLNNRQTRIKQLHTLINYHATQQKWHKIQINTILQVVIWNIIN